ncbi:unnamed protein product [Ceutorhynchus assimilis]|uniref:Protein sleepless n=1 Tax=Ceutorhynchus assimilis TaxID=467358 RepID=A0A9N9MKF0_9CUCU|nr:unnamed protein product [Ceutorhynchus assimilis]
MPSISSSETSRCHETSNSLIIHNLNFVIVFTVCKRMSTKTRLLSLVLLCLSFENSYGLKCYTCSATENDADTSCADDVVGIGKNAITDCDKKYCTITRIDYKDPRGKLASLNRNCVDKVPADGVTEDATFRSYQRSCKTDLCNSGSGKSDINTGSRSLGDKSTIYAPGTGRSAGTAISVSVFGLLVSVAMVLRL